MPRTKSYTGTVVTVTQRHINRSNKLRAAKCALTETCPISLAVRSATGSKKVSSAGDFTYIGDDSYQLPAAASQFIIDFDTNYFVAVQPMTFRLGRRRKESK